MIGDIWVVMFLKRGLLSEEQEERDHLSRIDSDHVAKLSDIWLWNLTNCDEKYPQQ